MKVHGICHFQACIAYNDIYYISHSPRRITCLHCFQYCRFLMPFSLRVAYRSFVFLRHILNWVRFSCHCHWRSWYLRLATFTPDLQPPVSWSFRQRYCIRIFSQSRFAILFTSSSTSSFRITGWYLRHYSDCRFSWSYFAFATYIAGRPFTLSIAFHSLGGYLIEAGISLCSCMQRATYSSCIHDSPHSSLHVTRSLTPAII